MKLSLSGVGIALIGAVSAAPASSKETLVNALEKRNVCDGVNASPILYQEYYSDSCPAANTMAADGTCPGQDFDGNRCASFCQVRTYFEYGMELPIENTYCPGPQTCSISDTETRTVTKSGSINANWELGFKAGISGSFTYADATAHSSSHSINLGDNQCGYWTIVPVYRTTCGTVTEGYAPAGPAWLCAPLDTYENICVTQQRLLPSGAADSVTIFVKTECASRMPLPADQQNDIYNKPGVALDRGKYLIMAENWQGVAVGHEGLTPSVAQCGANPYTMPVADVWTASNNLDAVGDQDCWTPDHGSCINVTAVNGNAVDICGQSDGKKLCANCARVGNYVAGLTGCVDANGNVGAKQDIVETPGLSVQI